MLNDLGKRLIAFFVLLAALLVFTNSSYARMAYYTRNYYVQLQFGNSYEGQKVKSVMAHIGIQKGQKWFDVENIELTPSDSEFKNKITIVDRYESVDPVQYLLVTYLVRFASGEEHWTPVFGVQSTDYGTYYEDCSQEGNGCYNAQTVRSFLANMIDEFNSTEPKKTQANYFTTYH